MAQWDAFISYARSASTLEAQKLQTAIQTFAKPWYRLRAVRIFRDDSSMSANPALWSSIEQGLQQARWLVVLLSRSAARSEYVAGEVGWWVQHKGAATILLVTGTPTSYPVGARAAADGATVLVADSDGRLARYEARTGRLLSAVPGDPDLSGSVAAIGADLATVATVSYGAGFGPVTVRDATTGAVRYTVERAGEAPQEVLFAAGPLWVRYYSGLIERRDPAGGALQRTLPVRLRGSGALSEGAGVVAIPTDDGVALYDASADSLIGSVGFPGNWQSTRRGVALSPDASVLVSAFEPLQYERQGLAVGTQLAPEALVAVACRSSGSSLTADDWRALIGPDVPADLTCK